jgi:DNA-binding NtrC family response regulator
MSDPHQQVSGRTTSILLVDDDEAFCYAASRYLLLRGYLVTTVLNGTFALQALDRGTFDLLVIDCVMPPGTVRGAALGRMVRYRDAKQPIIFITAHRDIVAIEGELPGPILFKPIDLAELYGVISKIFA